MEFHSLSRRDLQALCKKNKIPANMTNVAMADALQALETVEGLEEVLTHSEADSLNTPAKAMAATSVYCASNRQRTVKEETETSKLTRTRQGTTRKDMPETAPPSACVKFSAAHSSHKNAENSTVQQAYSTRRSTRLMEKKMCQLSLKENDDMVDAKAILDKDSQEMQRQFSEDMDNSLVDKTFTDESNLTKEATEEPNTAEVPVQNMLLENQEPLPIEPSMKLKNKAGDLENSIIEVEESINDKDCKDVDEGQPMQEDAVGQLNEISGELEKTQHNVNVSKPINMIEDEFVMGSESKATEIAITPVCQPMQEVILGSEFKATENAVAAEDETQKVGIDETGSRGISCDTVMEDNDDAEAERKKAFEMQASEFSDDHEFDFLLDSSDNDSDDNEEVDQPVDTPEPLLDGDNMANIKKISESAEEDCIPNRSSSKKSASAHQVVHNSDNKEKFEISSRLQEENIAATKTPIEKKSLRQLKRMVKAHKQQKAEEKRPLQVHAVNV